MKPPRREGYESKADRQHLYAEAARITGKRCFVCQIDCDTIHYHIFYPKPGYDYGTTNIEAVDFLCDQHYKEANTRVIGELSDNFTTAVFDLRRIQRFRSFAQRKYGEDTLFHWEYLYEALDDFARWFKDELRGAKIHTERQRGVDENELTAKVKAAYDEGYAKGCDEARRVLSSMPKPKPRTKRT